MACRNFVDRDGNAWEVRDISRSEWEFKPAGGNRGSVRTVRAPNYENDPFELSNEEVQKLLDGEGSPRTGRAPSPFTD